MSNEFLDAAGQLGKSIFEIWDGETQGVLAGLTPEEKQLAQRVSKRAAEGALRTITGGSDPWKDDVDAQLKNLEVGLALDVREVVRKSFWPSVIKAVEDGVGMLARLLNR